MQSSSSLNCWDDIMARQKAMPPTLCNKKKSNS